MGTDRQLKGSSEFFPQSSLFSIGVSLLNPRFLRNSFSLQCPEHVGFPAQAGRARPTVPVPAGVRRALRCDEWLSGTGVARHGGLCLENYFSPGRPARERWGKSAQSAATRFGWAAELYYQHRRRLSQNDAGAGGGSDSCGDARAGSDWLPAFLFDELGLVPSDQQSARAAV